jgi:hypothetical protein
MSFHIAVLITSERCGHCRTMRGDGILLTKAKIQKENKQPTVPGGMYYDANFMKKIITTGTDSAKVRVMNIHYKAFNPAEGITDISVFTLEPDGKTVRQSVIKEKDGKTMMDIYTIGDIGKKINSQPVDSPWEETLKAYVPVNLPSYAMFYPTLALFHYDSWVQSIQNHAPVYGYINGLQTKDESPYGAAPTQQPQPGDFVKFLGSFFDGSRKLLVKPESSVPVVAVPEPQAPASSSVGAQAAPAKVEEVVAPSKMLRVPTKGACDKLNVRLYVKE